MLGRQALLRIVEVGGLAVGVLESFEGADRIVLVHVSGGIAQRLDPVAREDGGVFLRAALRGGDHGAAGLFERGDRAAAGARGVHDQLALRGNAVAQGGKFRAGNIRADEIEFVLDAVEGAVADQDQHEVVFGLGLLRDLAKRVASCALRGIRAGEREDVASLPRGLQQLVEIVGHGGEALLVVGLAAEPRDGDVIDPGARGQRGKKAERHNRCDRDRRRLHTIPHFRRSSHSEDRSRISTRKMTGIFHSSLVSRMVMPASE